MTQLHKSPLSRDFKYEKKAQTENNNKIKTKGKKKLLYSSLILCVVRPGIGPFKAVQVILKKVVPTYRKEFWRAIKGY